MKNSQEIKNFIAEKIAEECRVSIDEISFEKSFNDFNMDSLALISMTMDIETFVGVGEINPTVFHEFNTINKLTEWLVTQK